MSRKPMLKDLKGFVINAFVPDPAKSQAPTTSPLALSTVLNVSDCVAILVRSDAAINRYFNSDTTKTRTIPADTDTIIMIDSDVTELTLVGAANIEIEAM